jgi:D-alanyl-D-alanine carboxypeptidase
MAVRFCRSQHKLVLAIVFFALTAPCLEAQPGSTKASTLSPDLTAKIDSIAQEVLSSTGVPSASISIVKDGKIAYSNAFGMARLEPPTPATPQMRYSIGSVSKQFTAAAILLLQQDGKLKVDDPVSKFLPDLTRANEVTIRMLLSHTSGYQDFWAEDYVMPPMLKPANPQYILETWAKKPLDFDPGTKWQYSNTNYVIAGRIVELVSGEPLFRFLQERVFTPLQMKSVYNSDLARLGDTDAQGYLRYSLGPLRSAPKEGAGWMFAAGELAMPANDLSLWNISMMNRSLLSPQSYKEMFTSVKLKDGSDTHYGLGVFIQTRDGHALWEHSGEVSGFVSENAVYPDDHAAIAVLTNEDASEAAAGIARQIAPLLLGTPVSSPAHQADLSLAQAKAIFVGLQDGKLDRSLLTPNTNAYFSEQAIGDFASSLKPLGVPTSFVQAAEQLRGGMTFQAFRVSFNDPDKKLLVTTYTMPDGKIEQYLVLPAPQ